MLENRRCAHEPIIDPDDNLDEFKNAVTFRGSVPDQSKRRGRVDYCDTPCQIRIDWLHPHRSIVDLKTTADLTWFEHEVRHLRSISRLTLNALIGRPFRAARQRSCSVLAR